MENEQSGSFACDLTYPIFTWKIVGNLPVEEVFKKFSNSIDEA
jgi:hypothetical protein